MKPVAIIFAALAVLFIIGISEGQASKSFEQTVSLLKEFDGKYGTSIDDYKFGYEYMLYNPRFPDPLNPKEVDGVVEDLLTLRSRIEGDEPSFLLVDARESLFWAEISHS